MSEAKHTPGPWEVTSISIETGNVSVGSRDLRIVIADVTNAASFGDMLAGAMSRSGGSFDPSDARTQFANARLIAAAPDMLAALISVRARFQHLRLGPDESAVLDRVQTAIAKAEART